MLYSNPCEYAIRALTELALRDGAEWVDVGTIAEAAELPRAYLGKILKGLVEAGILRSTRGPGGGYRLARDPESISLLDVKVAIDGERDLERCAVGLDPCSDETPCPLHDDFKRLRTEIRDYLASTSLEQIARGIREKSALLGESE